MPEAWFPNVAKKSASQNLTRTRLFVIVGRRVHNIIYVLYPPLRKTTSYKEQSKWTITI